MTVCNVKLKLLCFALLYLECFTGSTKTLTDVDDDGNRLRMAQTVVPIDKKAVTTLEMCSAYFPSSTIQSPFSSHQQYYTL